MIYWVFVKRIVERTRKHDCLGLAAEAAFGAILSLVPAFIGLIALTSHVGLSEQSIQFVVSSFAALLPRGSADVVDATVRAALSQPAPGLLTTSLALTLWSASWALMVYTKAINRAYGGAERKFAYWRNRGVSLLLIPVVAAPIGVASVASLFGRAFGEFLASRMEIGPTGLLAWGTLRWLAVFLVVVLVLSLIYTIAPHVGHKPLDVLPGATIATAIWAVLSIGFNEFTASRFARYQIYGGLSALVVFLLWLYLSSAALIIGAEVNAELAAMRRSSPER